MASPQTENGYTRIANELLEALIATRIPGEVRRVFDHIMRMTYGYNRKTFETTHSEMAHALRTPRQRVTSSLQWLKAHRLIIGTEKCAGLDRNFKTTLGIQKDFEQWIHGTEKCAEQKSVPLTAQKSVPHTIIKEKRKKGRSENGTEKRSVQGFTVPAGATLSANGHPWIDADAWDDFVQHRAEIKKSLTALSVKKSIEFLSGFKSQQREIIDTSIRCRWQGLFPPKKPNTTDDVDGPRLRVLEVPSDVD